MTRKTLILVLIASISNIIHGQQLVVDGDGTSGKEIIARNEGNSNSHTYFSAFTASDQFNTTPTFEGLRSRGTLDNPQDVNSGDRLLLLTGRPYINGVYRPASTIEFKTGDSPSVSSHPTYITISTTDNNSTIRQERLRIAANG